jgi:FAD/FMN-containing dehydrogenase/Fe-S oxidoreductase
MLDSQVSGSLEGFLRALKQAGFEGDIQTDKATRLVGATDNSIYRIEPAAIVFPKSIEALHLLARMAGEHRIPITARGGGTGTNGQSLTEYVVVDVSRHMNRILHFDAEAQIVVVQPGVVLDQLNAYVGERGFFFPPSVSTSSRATIGGMFATDASGKGSRRYGRTSDWVREVDVILAHGERVRVAGGAASQSECAAPLNALLARELADHRPEIERVFPIMNRGLTGYNLKEALPEPGKLNLIKLLAGSEGTLAITGEMVLRVARKPKYRALTVLAYDDCLAALAHVPALVPADPVAVEFLDDKIIALAATTPMWSELEALFGDLGDAQGFLFVEFTGDDMAAVEAGQAALSAILAENDGGNTGVVVATEARQIDALWEMRKLSVGLLAAAKGRRVGIPFVEDAAVPPENLVDFVREFRDQLDRYGLDYGMYGHADVGCVHVRPMLDMRAETDRELIRVISDDVANLCQRQGGLIWGEHGKGVRGEYVRQYMGDELYALMARIKAAFDPDNLLNPGKLVAPDGAETSVMKLDAVPFRGARDERIDENVYGGFAKSVSCNGNGACFNWAPYDPMCPSYKATRDRVQGPKGRATLLREWTYAKSENRPGAEIRELEEALFESLETCLSCKSCTGQCPVRIDIPDMKALFLNDYFQTRRRPLRDLLVKRMETVSILGRRVPALANLMMGNPASRALIRALFKIEDAPGFSDETVESILGARGIKTVVGGESLPQDSVVLVIDSFTGPYETNQVAAFADTLQALDFQVFATPMIRNGKALQVRGFTSAFDDVRRESVALLNEIGALGAPMIGMEPAVANLLASEFSKGDLKPTYKSESLDRFLFDRLDRLTPIDGADEEPYKLFLHCTEKTSDPATGRRWKAIFAALGLKLDLVSTGCCGMAGLFGHESEHLGMSKRLYEMSWEKPMSEAGARALATGFSCRSQTKRMLGKKPRHPAELLGEICRQR